MDHKRFVKLMDHIIMSLRDAGYDPRNQLTGYVQTGDSTYITRKNGARKQIILLDLQQIREYLKRMK